MKYFGTFKKSTPNSVPRHNPTIDLWKIGLGKTPLNLNISSWNINGIRSVHQKGFLKEFLTKYVFDMVCLNETKIDLKSYTIYRPQMDDILHNYFQYWNFCKISSGYSGVAIFSKYQPIKVYQDIIQQPQHSLEGRVLTLQFQKFYLLNCYKPNSGSQLQRLSYRVDHFDKKFEKYVSELMKYKPIILVGDFNVAHQKIDLKYPQQNHKNSGFTKQQRQSFTSLLKLGLKDSFRELYPKKQQYTWWSYRSQSRLRNIGWRIDYALVDQRIKILESQIYNNIMGSDHCPISVSIKLE